MSALYHVSGASPGSPSAGVMSTRVQRLYRRDEATELLYFGGSGEVLPRGGAVGLAFEDCTAHLGKVGQAEEAAKNCKGTGVQARRIRALIDKQFHGNTMQHFKGI